MKICKILVVAIITIAMLAIPASAQNCGCLYNGIPGSTDNPPHGAVLDEQTSTYYNTPIAYGNDEIYFYILGCWYAYEDFFGLPCEMFMYGSYPGRGNANVPINNVTLLFLIGSMCVIGYIIKKK